MPTTGLTTEDIPDLIEKVRGQMLDALKEISRPAPVVSEPSSDDKTPTPEPDLVVQDGTDVKVGKLIDTADDEEEQPLLDAASSTSVAGGDGESQASGHAVPPQREHNGKVALA